MIIFLHAAQGLQTIGNINTKTVDLCIRMNESTNNRVTSLLYFKHEDLRAKIVLTVIKTISGI